MLQTNGVATRTMDLLRLIAAQPCLENFFLVGGTSLALQIGHRLSYDLDFFSSAKNNIEVIENELLQVNGIKLKSTSSYALFLASSSASRRVKLSDLRASMKLNQMIGASQSATPGCLGARNVPE